MGQHGPLVATGDSSQAADREGETRVSDGARRASRLELPRWLDVRMMLGAALVLTSVVVGARVLASADHFSEVYVARHSLVPGEHLAAADLRIGQVRFDGQGASYVAAAGPAPVGYVVTRYVASGELLPLTALEPVGSAIAVSRDVTVPVAPGHLPDSLGHGDLVDVYVTPKVAVGARVPQPTRVLAAVAVDSEGGGAESLAAGSTVAVELVVPAAAVATMVHAVEAGTIDLVRVPASSAATLPQPSSPVRSSSPAAGSETP